MKLFWLNLLSGLTVVAWVSGLFLACGWEPFVPGFLTGLWFLSSSVAVVVIVLINIDSSNRV